MDLNDYVCAKYTKKNRFLRKEYEELPSK